MVYIYTHTNIQTRNFKNVSSFLPTLPPLFPDVSYTSVVGSGNLAVGFGVAISSEDSFLNKPLCQGDKLKCQVY